MLGKVFGRSHFPNVVNKVHRQNGAGDLKHLNFLLNDTPGIVSQHSPVTESTTAP